MNIPIKAVALFCLAVLSLVSCKRITHADTTISGRAYNQTDDAPLVGYEVKLVETETPARPFSPLTITVLDTRTTDANGNFDFGDVELKKRTRFSYTVEFDTRGENFMGNAWQNGDYEMVYSTTNIGKGEENIVDIGMVANGELKVLLYNENEHDENDEITVYALYDLMGKAVVGWYKGGGGYDNESYNNRTNFRTAIAGDFTLEWHVTRNGQTEVFSDEISVIHNQKSTYEIHY